MKSTPPGAPAQTRNPVPPAERPSTVRRRRDILDAALACFSEKGYAQTTLADIRQRSGASTGSIYHLFASKEEIAGALYLEALREYQSGLTALVASTGSAEAAVRGVVEHFLVWSEEHAPLARFIFLTRQSELLPAVRAELAVTNRDFFRALRARFEPHVASGVVRAMPWDLFHVIVIGPANEHVRQWLAGRNRTAPRAAVKDLAEAAWRGVQAPKPRRPRRTWRRRGT